MHATQVEANWAMDVAQYDIPGVTQLAQARMRMLQALDANDWPESQYLAIRIAAHALMGVIDAQIYALIDDDVWI